MLPSLQSLLAELEVRSTARTHNDQFNLAICKEISRLAVVPGIRVVDSAVFACLDFGVVARLLCSLGGMQRCRGLGCVQ